MSASSPSRTEYYREYRKANAEKRKIYNAKWFQEHKAYAQRRTKLWREKNPGRTIEIRKRWRDKNPAKQLVLNAKLRAKKLGIPFNLTAEDVVIPNKCPVLGIELCWTGKRTTIQDNTLSLDRIRPELGYVRGNVYVISWRANRLKSNGSLEEFEKIVTYLRNTLG